MNWRALAARWKHPEPEAPVPPAQPRCTCHPADVPLGLAAFDCPVHGFEAQQHADPPGGGSWRVP